MNGGSGVNPTSERARSTAGSTRRYLNITMDLVSQWEHGEERRRGASVKQLTLVAKKGLVSVAYSLAAGVGKSGIARTLSPDHKRRK